PSRAGAIQIQSRPPVPLRALSRQASRESSVPHGPVRPFGSPVGLRSPAPLGAHSASPFTASPVQTPPPRDPSPFYAPVEDVSLTRTPPPKPNLTVPRTPRAARVGAFAPSRARSPFPPSPRWNDGRSQEQSSRSSSRGTPLFLPTTLSFPPPAFTGSTGDLDASLMPPPTTVPSGGPSLLPAFGNDGGGGMSSHWGSFGATLNDTRAPTPVEAVGWPAGWQHPNVTDSPRNEEPIWGGAFGDMTRAFLEGPSSEAEGQYASDDFASQELGSQELGSEESGSHDSGSHDSGSHDSSSQESGSVGESTGSATDDSGSWEQIPEPVYNWEDVDDDGESELDMYKKHRSDIAERKRKAVFEDDGERARSARRIHYDDEETED
ncbi:hypothetical protein C8R47DRAFT_1081546, partial [Mycena vitilis]